MAADSGRLRDACAHAHTGSERAVGYKLSRGEVGFWPVFGTATMPTSTSGASSRVEGKGIGTLDGIMVGFTTGFGTVTLPTDASVASWRGEEGFYRHFGTTTLPTGTSEASRRGEGGFCKGEGCGIGQY